MIWDPLIALALEWLGLDLWVGEQGPGHWGRARLRKVRPSGDTLDSLPIDRSRVCIECVETEESWYTQTIPWLAGKPFMSSTKGRGLRSHSITANIALICYELGCWRHFVPTVH